MAILADAGVEVVGENRAQDLERKHAAYGDAFRWHFIGHLQSNKVKVVNRICELVHSLSSESAGGRLSVPALARGRISRARRRSRASLRTRSRATCERFPSIRGLMTMPPLAADPEASRPYFRRLRELAAEHGLASSAWEHPRTTASRWRRERRSCASARRCSASGLESPGMGFSDLWSRTLVYFGIAEEEEWDESGYATNEQLEESYSRRDRQNVRRLPKHG